MLKSPGILACVLLLSAVPLSSQAQERFGYDSLATGLSRSVGGSTLGLSLYRYNFTGWDHNFNDGTLGLDRYSNVQSRVRTQVTGSVLGGYTTLFLSDVYASINRTLTAGNQYRGTYAPYHTNAVILNMQQPRFQGSGRYEARGLPMIQTGEREFYKVPFELSLLGVSIGGNVRLKGSLSVTGNIKNIYKEQIGIGNSIDYLNTGSSISASIRGRGELSFLIASIYGELVLLQGSANDDFTTYRDANYDGNAFGATLVKFASLYTETRSLGALGGKVGVSVGVGPLSASADLHDWGNVLNATGTLSNMRFSPTLLSAF